MAHDARAGGLADRLFALALGVWPADLRRRLGDEMRATFAARLAARRGAGRGVVRLVLFELAGTATAGLRARARVRPRVNPRIVVSTRRSTGMDGALQDLRFALRAIGRNPGFAAVVVLVLALGTGANTAIFSLVNAALLRPLPVREPERLVAIRESNPEKGWVHETAAPANLLDWREGVAALEDVAAHGGTGTRTLTGLGEPEVVRSVEVTGNFFQVLGVEAALGRTFREEETWAEAPTVILSDGFWARRFGRDPSVLGRMLTLDGVPHEVVGVMPPGLTFPAHELDIWTPTRWDPAWRTQVFFRRAHWMNAIARLRPGVTLEQADAELQVVVRRLQQEYPETNRAMGAAIYPLHEFLTAEIRAPLLVLLGGVLLLLLAACANVGNLLLVRAAGRKREMAVRAALGAGPARNARLALTESLLLSVLGGAAGVAIGLTAVRASAGLLPAELAPADGALLDARVLAFAIATTVLAGLAFGAVPALAGAKVALTDALKESARGGTASRRTVRGGHVLVAAEVALALVLVLGAGLLTRSFIALREVDPGFRSEGRVSARISLPPAKYDVPEKAWAFYDGLLERLASSPGIRTAGLARTLPLTGTSYTSDFVAEGWAPGEFGAEVSHQSVSPSYFEALGIPLLRGRPLQSTDRAGTEPVLLINEALARRHFPDEDPIGKRIAFDRQPGEGTTWWRVVGVVGNTRQREIATAPQIEVYKTYWQDPARGLVVVVSGARPERRVIRTLHDAVAALDADIPLASVRPLEQIYAESLSRDRLLLVLIGAFGGLALVLAALGVYGVASQAAHRRTQEIGIRVALGASGGDVLRLVVLQALAPVAAGVLLGLAAGLAATRLLEGVLYEVEPTDPATFLVVPLVLAAVAVLASWLPARSALRGDPVAALRAE